MNKDPLDRWSIVHAISGVGFGLLFFVIELNIGYAIAAGFAVAVGWEFIEFENHEGESKKNSLTDIVVAGVTATLAFFVAQSLVPEVTREWRLWVGAVLAVWTVGFVTIWYVLFHWKPEKRSGILHPMINKKANLSPDIFDLDKLEQQPTRNGFGRGLVTAGREDERVLALCADLAESTRMHWFQEEFPERYIEIGVAEQNLAGVGAGLARYGKIPFIASYATFSPGRNNEQIRTAVCINNVPVKIVGSHAGLSVGPDGATHQALEDIGLTRMMPRMVVLSPCDALEAEKATVAAAKTDTPVYIRLARANSPMFTTDATPFEIGKAQTFFETEDPQVGIIATGALVHQAILAAKELADEGVHVSVVNLATIKPMDADAVTKLAEKTGAIVTVEEHQKAGGMGSAVAEILAESLPTPIEFVGVDDDFGQSGNPDELIKHYGLDKDAIKEAVKRIIARK